MAFGAGANTIISPLSQENAEKYFSVESYSIEQVEDTELDDHVVETLLDQCSASGVQPWKLNTVVIDQIINYGKQIWEVVVANKPVVNVNEMSANALPQGIDCWTGLSNWELPNSNAYEITYKNGFGMEVVKFKYRLFYTYGGQFEDTGAYLANVSVTPMSIDVAWGFKFDATADAEQVLNIGPLTNPIAGMELAMKWKVETPLKISAQQIKFFVTGDGRDKAFD
jgi:hypothetical protein